VLQRTWGLVYSPAYEILSSESQAGACSEPLTCFPKALTYTIEHCYSYLWRHHSEMNSSRVRSVSLIAFRYFYGRARLSNLIAQSFGSLPLTKFLDMSAQQSYALLFGTFHSREAGETDLG
jgi:hypothetical protein